VISVKNGWADYSVASGIAGSEHVNVLHYLYYICTSAHMRTHVCSFKVF